LVGVFGYDLTRSVEKLGAPPVDTIDAPDLSLILTDTLIAIDHVDRKLMIVTTLNASEHPLPLAYAAAVERLKSLFTVVTRAKALTKHPRPRVPQMSAEMAPSLPWRTSFTRVEFEEGVSRVLAHIVAGDVFQTVLSQRWSTEIAASALSIYRALREVNPAPYMYLLDFGSWQVVGASPEALVTLRQRSISMRPIAGTRKRGRTSAEDQEMISELMNDEKEQAEHVMLVDVCRNDLSRVCEVGSVRVANLMELETYSHVFHIASTVTGRLRDSVDGIDALRLVSPAATLSGAPKIRAMEIIDMIEPVRRGSYGGAVGLVSWNGDLITAIHIRTAVLKGGVAHVQAGSGVVADSTPAAEYDESVSKSASVRRAIEVACVQPRVSSEET
jgi:anthranilate synthase component 1